MPYDISTQTTSKAVFDRIINRITDATFMGGAGNVWAVQAEYRCWTGVSTAAKTDAAKNRHSYVLKGVGEAGTDNIFVGLAYSERQAVSPFASETLPATGNIRLFGFQKFNAIIAGTTVLDYNGDWDGSSVAYVKGDVVTVSGRDYLCIKDHTSSYGDNAPDAPGQTVWDAKTPFVGAYDAVDDIVVDNYVLNAAGTSLWKVTTALADIYPAWNSGTTYATGEKVSNGGVLYRSLANGNLNRDPATMTAYWAVVSASEVGPGAAYSAGLYTQQNTFRGEWTFATVYSSTNWVTLDGDLFQANATHTSTAGTNPAGEQGGTYWVGHTAHYKSQKYGANRKGHFTEDEGFIDQWQTGLCWSGFHKMWQSGAGNIPTWLIANTRRFMWVTKSSTTRWHFSYAGFLKPFGTACTNPYPLLLAANAWVDSVTPSSSDPVWQVQHMPYDYVEGDNVSGQPQYRVGNYPLATDSSRYCRLNLSWVEPPKPYPYSTETALGLERLPTGENYLRECWLHDGTGFVGALDGVYWCAAQGMASGDILTANGVDYLLVEDVYRASSGGMFAIKMD